MLDNGWTQKTLEQNLTDSMIPLEILTENLNYTEFLELRLKVVCQSFAEYYQNIVENCISKFLIEK